VVRNWQGWGFDQVGTTGGGVNTQGVSGLIEIFLTQNNLNFDLVLSTLILGGGFLR
jgi:hypothetical protein